MVCFPFDSFDTPAQLDAVSCLILSISGVVSEPESVSREVC